MFTLHPRLAQDTITVGQLPLCRLLLMNDASYPWFILVPMRENAREIHDLSPADRALLMEESAALSQALADGFKADKVNIAALGNVVPQLHVHHVARFTTDPAWPEPIWGRMVPEPYTPEMAIHRIAVLRAHLRAEIRYDQDEAA
ncbi:MAG: HIT domain-containing protein [Nitrospirae bacterium]|nr:HIT domain-containing protein [Nitrospirota bacterium]